MTSHCRSCIYKISEDFLLAFKFFRFNCCGLDVHKTWIFACIGITDANGRAVYKERRFSTFSRGLRELAAWLSSYNCTDVCMESTGKHWIPVFNILEKTCNVVLAHPKYTKPQKGIRPTVRMQNGFAICSCVIRTNLPLFRQLRSVISGIWYGTGSNSPTC